MTGQNDMKKSGRALLDEEMARQHADAAASVAASAEMAGRIAASLARTKNLLMIGMGASHYANRMAEPCFREVGTEAWAVTAAEMLQSPLPKAARTILCVSQSGESGEILELLQAWPSNPDMFGLTLDARSTLGRTLPSLIGVGGGEVAFAATRSLTITVALLDAVLAAMSPRNYKQGSLRNDILPSTAEAAHTLGAKATIAVAGRREFRGLAEANALMLMELARMPALGFEVGQFRHGPLELLSPQIGTLLLRGPGVLGAGVAGLARTIVDSGSTPVIFDCSGETPIESAISIGFPRAEGLAAILAMLPALQRMIIDIAAGKVERVGEPVRSTKITGSDDAA